VRNAPNPSEATNLDMMKRTRKMNARNGDMKPISLLGTLLILLSQIAVGEDKAAMPRMFRGHDIDGFSEWEFLPTGKLLAYQYSPDLTTKLRGPGPHTIYPTLSLDSLKWKLDGDALFIGRFDPRGRLSYDKNTRSFCIFEHAYDEVKELKFFGVLAEYCGDPVLKGPKGLHTRGKQGARAVKPPFRFLHTVTTEGFIEYEFCSDGKVVAYYDMEKTSGGAKSGDNLQLESFPIFKVELLTWKKGDHQIAVDHGRNLEIIYISDEGKKIASETGTWEPVEHLEFVSKLYSYCERPLPKGQR